MKLGPFYRFVTQAIPAIALGAAISGGLAQQNAVEPTSLALKADSPTAFTLVPGGSRSISLATRDGEGVTAVFEQAAGAVSATEACEGCPPDPRTNPAGVHSSISFRILGTDAGAVSFTVSNPSKTRAAEVVATVSLPHAARDADRRQVEAETSLAHAEVLRMKRDPANVEAAAAAYDHAIAVWRDLGDRADMARALAWKAMLLGFVKSDLPAAEGVAKQALGSVDALDGAEAANCWKIAGYIAAGSSDYDAAEKDYTAALALFKRTGDRLNQEILLDNKAKLARQQGKSKEALADAESAAEIAREIGDVQRQLSIAEELGSIYLERGELRPAYEAYQHALDLLKTTSYAPVEGYVWSDLGVLYTLVHEFDRAGEALNRATSFWQKNPNFLGQINTLDDLGELYLEQGKLGRALGYLQQGLETANAHSLPRQQVYLLRAIGAGHLRGKDLPGARQALERAREIALQIGQGDELAAVYCSLGDLEAAQSRWPEAKVLYEKCRSAASAAKSQYDVIHAEGGLARIGLETKQLEEALPHAEAALAEIESVRGHVSEQNLRTSFFASMHDFYDLDIAICMRLDRLHPEDGYAWKAFLVSERARARQLLDQMFAAGMRQPSDGIGGTLAAGRQALALPSSPRLLPLAAIQERLIDRNTGLLEYWIGTRSSYLWVVTRGGSRSAPSFSAATVSRASDSCIALSRISAATLAGGAAEPKRSRRRAAASFASTLPGGNL
jgi:tetratricopeptide (TPR) repeat protein